MINPIRKVVVNKMFFLFILSSILAMPEITLAQSNTIKLDDFNRVNNTVLATSSSGGATSWLETESATSNNYRVRVESNMLVLGSYNNATTPVGSSATEQTSFDISNYYATVYNQAATTLNWYFNFRQSRSTPSGFGSGFYGVAYVLGCTEANFMSATASGYAVIIGNASSPDPVKFVRFTGGLNANSNLSAIITTGEEIVNAYYSVKVSFDPCAKVWSLQVRNDGATTFSDPTTISATAITATDLTYTNSDLKYLGAAYSHGTANEKATFDNLYIPTVASAASVTYTWNGSYSTNFDDAANWTPNRTCFRQADILAFNSGSIVNLANIATQEIGQFQVTNNTTLILKAKTGATQTLNIFGGTGEDLLIEAGSSLTIDSNDPLEISLKSGASGKVYGSFTFQNTAASLGRAHRLLATDANAISFENGSQFIAKNLSGEPFGNSGTANIISFKANATYVSKDGASPFGLTTPNSKVVFETGSLYKHEQTGTAPKLDGRTYANFELNVTNNLAIIFGTSAATPTRIDNFTISSGNMNVTLASGSTPLPLSIKGNLTVVAGAALNFNPAAAVNTSLISFNSTVQQQISGNINFGTYANIEVNNAAGINLLSPLAIRGNLQLTKGNVSGSNLSFEDNATVSGASNISYVVAKVVKTGNDVFTFPTGKNGFYAPIAISAPTTITDKYVAEYFQANPTQVFGVSKDDSLAHISNTEYWDLERLSGTSDVKVTLSYDPARSAIIANQKDIRVAHFKNGSSWSNEGKVEVAVAQNYSLFATSNAQASFSPFTFGSVSGNNPLPVELISFTAGINDEFVTLSWSTASEMNNDRFEIERSQDGKKFLKIGEQESVGNSNTLQRYAFTDKNCASGISYYRLKQIDTDGTSSYSKIIEISLSDFRTNVTVYPNPASNFIIVSFSGLRASNYLEVADLLGKPLKKQDLNSDEMEIKLDISDLPAGTYLLRTENSASAIKFIKNY
jgi:hypothetical protein